MIDSGVGSGLSSSGEKFPCVFKGLSRARVTYANLQSGQGEISIHSFFQKKKKSGGKRGRQNKGEDAFPLPKLDVAGSIPVARSLLGAFL